LYQIGPTFAGRLKSLHVQVGEQVQFGQVLGEMDPVDLDERLRAQEAVLKRTQAALREAQAREVFARTQAQRYEQLFAMKSVSDEALTTKRQEWQIAEASLSVVREDLARVSADYEALLAQRNHLHLVSPTTGVVVLRDAEPGSTVVAGQVVVEVVDPASLWINVRFDQLGAGELASGLPAQITLRSRQDQRLSGRVLRVEPKADAVTEELLAKIVFEKVPVSLLPLGELAEVVVDLPELAPAPVIPNAALRREGGRIGVWRLEGKQLQFVPIQVGRTDLDGQVQIRQGLDVGDSIVLYSEKPLTARSRIHVVEAIPGVGQ
jgi:RND family efflux transporter MFP subunit